MKSDLTPKQIKYACKKSFQFFFEYMSELKLTNFHKQLCKDLVSNQNVLILSPRKSGKSTLIYYYVVWILINCPDANILVVSSKFEGSKSCIRAIKYILMSHKFKELFGGILDDSRENTSTSINIKRDHNNKSPHPSVVAASTNGGQIIGKRTSHIIIDDIVTDKTCDKADTEELQILFEKVILPTRLNRNVPIKITATRFNTYDFNQYLMDVRKDFAVRIYPAIDEDGNSFCPELYTIEELLEIRDNMHIFNWSSQFMNSVDCMMETAKFKFDDINYYSYGDLPNLKQCTIHLGVDLAISLKESADRFCLVVAAKQRENESIYIVDKYLGRIPFDKQVEVIIEFASRYGANQINIESVAYQAALAQHLLYKGYPAKKIPPTGSKEERLMALVPYFKGGRILFPKSFTEFINEYIGFGNPRIHDDTIDAVGLAVADLISPLKKPGKMIHRHRQSDVEFFQNIIENRGV